MPTADDLMGVGMSAQQAEVMGNQPDSVACIGTTQGTATTIKTSNTELIPSASNTGAILPATAKIGTPYFVFNSQSTTAVVYAPSGATLNGTLNGSLNVAQNKGAMLWRYKNTAGAGQWASFVAA